MALNSDHPEEAVAGSRSHSAPILPKRERNSFVWGFLKTGSRKKTGSAGGRAASPSSHDQLTSAASQRNARRPGQRRWARVNTLPTQSGRLYEPPWGATIPHGDRIVSVDTSGAEKLPGVRACMSSSTVYGVAELRAPTGETSRYPVFRSRGSPSQA